MYAGRIVAFWRIVLLLFELSVAVITCGYMNSASADPSASVAYARLAARSPGHERTRRSGRARLLRHRSDRRVEDLAEPAELVRDVDDRDQTIAM